MSGSLSIDFPIAAFGDASTGVWGLVVGGPDPQLALGALPRLARKPSAGAAAAGAAAILVLANSRPFEGTIFLLLLGVALQWWARRRGNIAKLIRVSVILPLAAGFVLTTGFMAYYNWETTGDPWLMPYVLNSREYHFSPPTWLLPAASRPARFRGLAAQKLWD